MVSDVLTKYDPLVLGRAYHALIAALQIDVLHLHIYGLKNLESQLPVAPLDQGSVQYQ